MTHCSTDPLSLAGVIRGCSRRRTAARGLARLAALALAFTTSWASAAPAPPSPEDRAVRALVSDEETGLNVTRRLNLLLRDVLDLRLPGHAAAVSALFTTNAVAAELTAPDPLPPLANDRECTALPPWSPSPTPIPVASRGPWASLFDQLSQVDHAHFHFLRGAHAGGDPLRYQSQFEFTALARARTGEWWSLRAELDLEWRRDPLPDGRATEWRIQRWTGSAMEGHRSRQRLFSEVLDRVLATPAEVSALRRSQHYEAVVAYYQGGMKKLPHPYFAPISVNQKEGLAVVDINGDGFDDLYLTVRLGRNLLLVNHGDGTFSEQAARYGLDLPGHTTCALFADFDNDGDPDALLGRSLLKSTYLENRGGKFVQLPIPGFMPMAVISMAAADYNRDGLLDVYLCTYRPAAPAGSGMAGGYAQVAREGDFDWPDEFFAPELAREFRRRVAEHRLRHGSNALDQLGPPNVLLVNRGGGRFEPAPENATVGLWRNSLQATWTDYNDDGLPDLYIPNDWGMNVLFRNDGTNGFRDVTLEMGLTYYGFSMGASFGDFDNDGREDLYVSNMHSEAGSRMTSRFREVDPQLVESAAGNYLYRRRADGRFEQVAVPGAGGLSVMKAGWSWGGCFADFNLDGYLDLYVLNGYFSAPRELASGLDLESNLWRTMLRADPQLSRPAFRLSPEWRRVPAPDHLGPQIDTRLAGVERQGDRMLVHSLHGHERNRFYSNQDGRSFADLSAVSGLDQSADSRGFALLDYDRDGWPDVALVNANQPLFNLYRNEMAAAGAAGGMLAVRFVGGNRSTNTSPHFTARDGYGARVSVDLGDTRLVREHRCGEGWSVQNSSTLLIGLGRHTNAASVTVRWPSGRTASTSLVPEGTLLTIHENPADSPHGESFLREPYRRKVPAPRERRSARPAFPMRAVDTAAPPAKLRVYTAFTTSSPTATAFQPALRHLVEALRTDGVDLVAVTVDPADDLPKLADFASRHHPAARLLNVPIERRRDAAEAFARIFGSEVPAMATVVTDGEGGILFAETGIPTVSALRARLPQP